MVETASPKIVLFDYDGVIVDTLDIFVDIINLAGRELDQPVSFAARDLQTLHNMSIANLVDRANVNPEYTREFIEILDRELHLRVGQTPIFPKMDEVISHLSKESRVGIVSATPGPIIQALLEHNDLSDCVHHIAGGDIKHPKAERIKAIVDEDNGVLANTWMIGDTVSDIEQGKLAGCRTVAVTWGWHCTEWLRRAGTDCEVSEVWGLVDCVNNGC